MTEILTKVSGLPLRNPRSVEEGLFAVDKQNDRLDPTYENNPRIVAAAVDAVARSLREFGWRLPIVVDTDAVIIVGHVRWLAAKKNGFIEVPVHVATELTADQVRVYRIADNRLGEIAEWDDRLLAFELTGLAESEFDLGALGFDSAELENLLRPWFASRPTDRIVFDVRNLADKTADMIRFNLAAGGVA